MITFLEGRLVEKEPTRIVLNVQGVGYEVFIPLSSYDKLPPPNESVKIRTFDHVREDAHVLYGFMTENERRMFLLLNNVSGIGPKLALTVLSGLSARDLKAAIAQGDIKRLSSVSGIGRKTAERMVVELKDKISEGEVLEAVAGGPGEISESNLKLRDAIMALISLGYKQAEAQILVRDTLSRLGPDASVEDIVRKSLAR